MRLLHHADSRSVTELSRDDLIELYRWPDEGPAPVVRSNFVSTLDGSVQGLDGRSGTINTESDHEVFALLRALSDVVLVGAGTIRDEGYRAVDLQPWQRSIRAAEGLAPFPTLVVVTRSLQLDPAFVTPPGEHGPVIVVTCGDHESDTLEFLRTAGAEIMEAPGPSVDLGWTLETLAARGSRRILTEGGPSLHRDLLASGLVDRLSLTVAPSVVGGVGHRSTSGAALAERADFDLEFVLLGDDQTLFTNYRRRSY
ncbi:MAG: pyrimidine reductase family protein [Microlunatus sp.]